MSLAGLPEPPDDHLPCNHQFRIATALEQRSISKTLRLLQDVCSKYGSGTPDSNPAMEAGYTQTNRECRLSTLV